MATITPAIGEVARPILAASCIGRIICTAGIPICAAMSGTSGPNEKKAALPLPISIAAKNTTAVITIEIDTPPRPIPVVPATRLSMKPRLIRPPEKISAATISVITEAKTLPIPCQNVPNSGKISFTLRL